jgi:DNA-binding PadR family transcriptional regulator
MVGEFNEFEDEGLSGKRLNELILERNVRAWTKISFSNIYYILDRLESLGYIHWLSSPQKDKTVGAPEKIYYLTNKGKIELKRVALDLLRGKALTTLELDLGLAASYVLSKKKVVKALNEHHRKLKKRFEILVQGYERQGGDKLHYQAWGVINHHKYITQSRLKLLSELIWRLETDINSNE